MEEMTKTAYVSPPHGALDITLIRDANPRVTISLDLGIPNFTVFSMQLPMAEGQPNAMSELIAESVHVLLDEVATFMMAMEYDEQVIVELYATVLATFKSMSTEADSAKEQDVTGQDPTVSIYEGTFDIPMTFVNETQKRVVTAATKIVRQPKVRHLELTYSPKEKTKPSDTARVIRQYRQRSIKTQPKPMYIIVYDQMGRATGTIPLGPGKNFKNELLKHLPKKGSLDFTAPMSFVSEQEMKAAPLIGIPRAISVGGMTYQPEAISGGDMALYHGPQDYIVKFPDGRSAIFPGRPTFRKMRLLNFPVPRNRYKWTLITEESLDVPKFDGKQEEEVPTEAPQEEVKEAGEPQENTQQKDMITPDQVMSRSSGSRGPEQIYLKPVETYDDIMPIEQLQKRLERDKLSGHPIYEGLMLIDRIGHYGTFEGKQVLVIPQYYIRRNGVKNDDGTWTVYHLRSDGRAQRVFGKIHADKFIDPKPVESSIGNREGV